MEDANKQTHSFGSGQQRGYHPRPYFYVQPPSQPYYLYQHWQLNNPYSHYGVPAGFNFGRPCMPPYQYMQYPGFVFPHAPIYPVDYRRMFEPRFQAPTWGDVPRPQQQQQQQQHHTQPHGRPEMACSEAQTDPSDTITKLIECLDKFRASELQGADRELDSGVASQSSGIFSPGEEKKSEEQGHVLPSAPHESHLESSAMTFSDSTAAVYDGESSQRSLDMLSPQVCWSGGLEEEDLPLDSSSIHEECPELEQPAVENYLLKEEVTDIQTDVPVAEASHPKCEAKESTPSLALSSTQPECSDEVSKMEHPAASLDGAKAEVNFRILRLPFDSVLSPEAASLSSSYYYLPMQATHERMSVLSPSLDELSSRDEMFSTDLDDMELYPKHVYADKRLAEVIASSPPAAEEVEEVWLPGLKSFVCACCGKSLLKETSRGRVHSSKMYRDDAGDSEEEDRYGRGCEQPVRVVVRKHSAPRKTCPLPQRRPTKPWYKRGQYKEQSDPVEQEEGHDDCKQEAAEGEAAEVDGSALQCRTCQDRLHREDLTTTDRSRRADGDVIPRRRQAAPLQRQETSTTQWKVMYQRPRDDHNDNEPPPPAHWERGSTMREPRC
ncbi:bucky ball [Parambassis ranga]|uniref:Bucky ball n=1 Tax=Parambassis ranga TaxID=210632 RepID=A0A6P7KNV0_9TELE|nr:uncharacterized protein LOC114453419 [Parambassis ranga]